MLVCITQTDGLHYQRLHVSGYETRKTFTVRALVGPAQETRAKVLNWIKQGPVIFVMSEQTPVILVRLKTVNEG